VSTRLDIDQKTSTKEFGQESPEKVLDVEKSQKLTRQIVKKFKTCSTETSEQRSKYMQKEQNPQITENP
jgi:hypothetical protein